MNEWVWRLLCDDVPLLALMRADRTPTTTQHSSGVVGCRLSIVWWARVDDRQ